MKKINKIFMLSLLMLCSCNNNNSSSSNIVSSSSTSSSSIKETTKIESSSTNNDIQYDGYYKAIDQSISYDEVRKSYIHRNDLPTKGDRKVLVVPTKFKHSNYAQNYGGYDKVKEDIQKVFFGETDETGWESVNTFYKKSSYNQLNIEGTVTDWFTLDKTFMELVDMYDKGYTDPTIYVLREIGKWYNENYGSAKDYDTDGDGYIDSIWIVYDNDANAQYGIDWAHTYWDFTLDNDASDLENPIPYTFAWASIKFMYEGNYKDEQGNSLVDAHTFIHETGHLLGLEDYYDYDNQHSFAGGLDMMDLNIGDHTGLSKYLLDWVDPYVVTKNCEITIRSFTETGDLILVKNDWNHSALDEYLLIEFYTPTGLNHLDSTNGSDIIYNKLLSNYGIKIYHVDARLAHYINYNFAGYTDKILNPNNGNTYHTRLAHSNTLSRSIDRSFSLYHLLENGGTSFLKGANKIAKEQYMFYENDMFDPDMFDSAFNKDEHFNDGEEIPFLIEVTSLTKESATLKFRKI